MKVEGDAPTAADRAVTPGRSRGRRRGIVVVGGVVVILAIAAVAAIGLGGNHPEARTGTDLPPATATISRTTLVETVSFNGTLGYGSETTVSARSGVATTGAGDEGGSTKGAAPTSGTGGDAGTVTWLPWPGSIVEPGEAIFTVDDDPVILVRGNLPPYRVLAPGVDGRDVLQFERNLSAFGYSGFTVDTAFTSNTAAAVKRWQKDLDIEETGTVDVDQILVAAGPVRIAQHLVDVGAPATGPVLTYTGRRRVVTVALDVAQQQLLKRGLRTSVTLPDGRTVTGRVARIGRVATASLDTATGASEGPTIPVTVTIANQAKLGTLDAAPVQLTVVVNKREDVLAVPVSALVALREGGYGVQVVEGSRTRYVAIRTGMFAGGMVEISGAGITEGMTVGVPA